MKTIQQNSNPLCAKDRLLNTMKQQLPRQKRTEYKIIDYVQFNFYPYLYILGNHNTHLITDAYLQSINIKVEVG